VESRIGKILIIDDFRTNIEYMRKILKGEGYEIHACDNAEFSFEIIKKLAFDLILLDIVMPKVDGYEVCGYIRKSELNSKTPVIFITTRKDEKSILRGFNHGAQDFIIRPFYRKELIARVNTHVELKRNQEKLESVNKTLEELVRIRTNELQSTLSKLKVSYKNLKKAQHELESLEKAKDNFLQIISHEIRTPLNGIIGFSELLQDVCKDEKYIDFLNMMHESVKRLENFCMKGLLVTQLKTDRYNPKITKTHVAQLIYETINQLNTLIAKNDLRVEYEINDIVIETDDYLLKNVIYNMLENALYYSPRNGLIQIKFEEVTDNYCQLIISDQGKGFPESVLHYKNKIFNNDDFIDNNPGLGIYTTSLIVKALKGNLILKNNLNRGATVIVGLKI
jgi:two-component system sensor histidine kinase/response regulator